VGRQEKKTVEGGVAERRMASEKRPEEGNRSIDRIGECCKLRINAYKLL